MGNGAAKREQARQEREDAIMQRQRELLNAINLGIERLPAIRAARDQDPSVDLLNRSIPWLASVPLREAIKLGRPDMVRTLIDLGANFRHPLVMSGLTGETPRVADSLAVVVDAWLDSGRDSAQDRDSFHAFFFSRTCRAELFVLTVGCPLACCVLVTRGLWSPNARLSVHVTRTGRYHGRTLTDFAVMRVVELARTRILNDRNGWGRDSGWGRLNRHAGPIVSVEDLTQRSLQAAREQAAAAAAAAAAPEAALLVAGAGAAAPLVVTESKTIAAAVKSSSASDVDGKDSVACAGDVKSMAEAAEADLVQPGSCEDMLATLIEYGGLPESDSPEQLVLWPLRFLHQDAHNDVPEYMRRLSAAMAEGQRRFRRRFESQQQLLAELIPELPRPVVGIIADFALLPSRPDKRPLQLDMRDHIDGYNDVQVPYRDADPFDDDWRRL